MNNKFKECAKDLIDIVKNSKNYGYQLIDTMYSTLDKYYQDLDINQETDIMIELCDELTREGLL